MNADTRKTSLAMLIVLGMALASQAAELEKFVGQPVDLSPWAYAWRADRAVQEKPEAYFIPRRLKRLDEVYRTIASRPTRIISAKTLSG